MVLVITSLAMTAAVLGAQAGEAWVAVHFGEDQAIAIEQRGVRVAGDTRTFWTATAMKEPEAGVAYTLTRFRIDCERETVSVLHHVSYDENNRSLGAESGGPADPIIPSSVGSVLYGAVCDGAWIEDIQPVGSASLFVEIAVAALNSEDD